MTRSRPPGLPHRRGRKLSANARDLALQRSYNSHHPQQPNSPGWNETDTPRRGEYTESLTVDPLPSMTHQHENHRSPVQAISKITKSIPASLRKFKPGYIINGRYRIERLLARGGMGCIYLGYQIPLERKVAIKILIPQVLDAEFRRRFLLEASINSRLTHQHIVTVHDYGETEDHDLFMVMEFLEGEPISKVIAREGRLLPGRACAIASQVARALRSAHRAGVIHRDLKPSNVMLLRDDGDDDFAGDFVKVMDFGLVKIFADNAVEAATDEVDLTLSGVMLGSPRYMSPEQIRSETVDPRTDIYSLGVLMFHMVAGQPPFTGQGSVEILTQHLKAKLPSMASIGKLDCPIELEVIIQRCLEKAKSDRYPSMEQLLSDIRAASRLNTPHLGDSSTAFSNDRPNLAAGSGLTTGARVTDAKPASLAEVLTGDFLSGYHGMQDELMLELVSAQKRRSWFLLTFLLLLTALLGSLWFTYYQQKSTASDIQWIDITLTSDPPGSEVLLDNKRLGITPLLYRHTKENIGELGLFTFRHVGRIEVTKRSALHQDVHIHATLESPPEAQSGNPSNSLPSPGKLPKPSVVASPLPQSTQDTPATEKGLRSPPRQRSSKISKVTNDADQLQNPQTQPQTKDTAPQTISNSRPMRPQKRRVIVESGRRIVPIVD
ncbi:MAG: protein kinase [Myxococcales bacterium]|nr:protein kinase [Myxococcales bacterium]